MADHIGTQPLPENSEQFEAAERRRWDLSRREFLRAAGFSFAGAMVFGCSQAPEQRALPLLEQPEGMIPGRADYYATTCFGCSAHCGMLAKSRDGRPIKLEGNPDHPLSRGGLCAVGQAALLGLYDSERLSAPRIGGQPTHWEDVDAQLGARIVSLRSRGGRVRYLSGPVASPTKRARIDEFLAGFADARHVVYHPTQSAAALAAHEVTHGVAAFPHLRFDRSRFTLSIDADFLGNWISPVEFTRAHSSVRDADRPEEFCHHVQIESRLSVTGSKADRRILLRPEQQASLLSQLASRVAERAGRRFDRRGMPPSPVDEATLDALAEALWSARGRCLVVCGSDEQRAHELCNFLNDALGNYGNTLDLSRPSHQLQGDERALAGLLDELQAGRVDALFVDGVNPLLDLPGAEGLRERLRALPLLVSFAPRADECAELAAFHCPDHHFLESWADVEAVEGLISFAQPLVSPMGETRAVVESLAAWSGRPAAAREQLQARWGSGREWHSRIHDGFAQVDRPRSTPTAFASDAARAVATPDALGEGEFSLQLYTKLGMPDSSHAYNPWLHELPDPISKAVWDNYACLSPAAAARLGVTDGDVVRIEHGGDSPIALPALVQPGQHDSVVAIALAYGSRLSRRFADLGPAWIEKRSSVGPDGLVGVSAAGLVALDANGRRFGGRRVRVVRTAESRPLARTQEHHWLEVPAHLAPPDERRRNNVRESTIAAILHPDAHAGEHGHPGGPSLWPDDHPYTGHHWGMAIDLTTCTGCSGCVVACQAENNVPVVGKDEVRRNREMHWIRIDRYYEGDGDELRVAHQPMMCQHCDHAPCETVCPVLATVHSEEGLNQQVYNRCVGTRYCMNNCPYKVRRFNWFDYAYDDAKANLALNPDIAVRSRGVMEKCSMCVQRIQDAKTEARRRGLAIADGEIQTACQQSCPAGAIVFGDMNDPQSRISRLIASGRHYRVLEEIGVRPTVGYLTLVRDRAMDDGGEQHG